VRDIDFDPEALAALDGAYARTQVLGDRLDEALDWIESEPPDIKAKRRAFTGGKFGIEVFAIGEEWLIIWAESDTNPSSPRVYFIGPSFL